MNVGTGTVAAQFLFWEYMFRMLGIVSLQCITCSCGVMEHKIYSIYVTFDDFEEIRLLNYDIMYFECVPGIHPVVFHAAKGDRESCGPEQTSHCTENPLYVFPEKELRGLSPNSYIHVSDRSTYLAAVK